jgi:hypothetical protein
VRQILTNLIDNGIKFTPENGTVTVASSSLVKTDECLTISVSDTGCGISLENHGLIFERLVQVKSTTLASRSGLGLGLFISKDLVTRQGGRLWLESKLGHGSTFYFTLPVFSLTKLCAHVFTAQNLDAGFVTLIAVDLLAVAGAVQADILPEVRKILERCIHPAQDVLLPFTSGEERTKTFFIVACVDARGFRVIARRISKELQIFDDSSRLKPIISSTTFSVAPSGSGDMQISKIMARIEQLIQAHFPNKEPVK